MKTSLYSLFDKKAQFHDKPIVAQNDLVAIRMIETSFNDQRSQDAQFVRTPEDYQLVKLGDWDDNTGELIPEHKSILDLITLKKVNENEK